jgi:murein DD-endopeptidase MepM/ murein hydrolase activator NlpD
MLYRAGAAYADAVQVGALIASAGRPIEPGTAIAIRLGEKNGHTRSVDRVALRAGIDLNLIVGRSVEGLSLLRQPIAVDATPLRVRGRVGDGLYWSLRAAGASPQTAAEYLQALAGEIDVGEMSPDDRFDLVLANRRAASGESRTGQLLYAGIQRSTARSLQLVRWPVGGRSRWVDAASMTDSASESAGMMAPVAGPITSRFGYRIHPILRYARFHSGIDFGANWGAPIVAAASGRIAAAGWAGGYGRQVRIAHDDGLVSSYSHMSRMVVAPGSMVQRGELIGYVGSSGLSTGPHLHYEVIQGGKKVNPLSVRFASAPAVDPAQVDAFKARLAELLRVGLRKS